MQGFNSIGEIINESYDAGKVQYTSFRKTPAITTTRGVWFDLSMSPGTPRPNYYTIGNDLTSTPFNDVLIDNNAVDYRRGIYHGQSVGNKYIHKIGITSNSASVAPATFMLCDYLMYYPFIDMDNISTQTFINNCLLPRYANGIGVKAFLVATNPYIGGASFQLTYLNSDDEIKTTIVHTSNLLGNITTIISSGTTVTTNSGPFLQLNLTDKGIKSCIDITFLGGNGGLASLVLVKPLATILLRENTATSETDFVYELPSLPKVYDGAYLNFLCLPNGNSASANIIGDITTIWK